MKSYDTNQKRLANELAETLNDRDALPFYLTLTTKYQEDFLRKILAKVMSIPEANIRRTRGALFTFLVTQSSHGSTNNARG
jgi:hypothetical protein